MENLPAPVEPIHGLISRVKRKIVDVVVPEVAQPTAMVSYSKGKPPVPQGMVSSTMRTEEPQQRIYVGNNLSQLRRKLKSSQVQRALRSGTFKPLPPEQEDVFNAEFTEVKDNTIQTNANLDKNVGYQKIVDQSLKDANLKPVKEMSIAEREARYESQGANGYEVGKSPLSFHEWWEYESGRGATASPKLKTKEELDEIFSSSDEDEDTVRPKISLGENIRKKTGKSGGLRKEHQKEEQKQKRKNPIAEAILWATDVSNPDAPNLRETAGIAARQAKQFGKKAYPVIKKTAKEGLQTAKWGIRAAGEIAEEFEKTATAQNILKNAESEYSHMKSAGRRTRESIAANGKKRHLTVSSLNKPKTFGTKTSTNPYGIVGLYERGAGGRTELHFYRGKNRITHSKVAKILTHRQIQETKKAAILGQQPVQTQAQAVAQNAPLLNNQNSPSGLAKKRVETHSALIKKRVQGNPIGQGIRASAPFTVVKKTIVL